jgi:hypothetical protein
MTETERDHEGQWLISCVTNELDLSFCSLNLKINQGLESLKKVSKVIKLRLQFTPFLKLSSNFGFGSTTKWQILKIPILQM